MILPQASDLVLLLSVFALGFAPITPAEVKSLCSTLKKKYFLNLLSMVTQREGSYIKSAYLLQRSQARSPQLTLSATFSISHVCFSSRNYYYWLSEAHFYGALYNSDLDFANKSFGPLPREENCFTQLWCEFAFWQVPATKPLTYFTPLFSLGL